LFEAFLFPYLTTRMFVYADQRDPVHLGTYGIMGRTTSAAQQAYVDRYSRLIREELARVPAVFSPNVNQHTALGSDRFHSIKIDGHDLAEAIGNWYFGRPGPSHLIAAAADAAGATRGARGRAGRGGSR
jgi:hypothetical protein